MDFSSELPDGISYSVLHLRTKAFQCKPLLISREKPFTLKVRHLLLLSEKPSNCIVLGIEVYVYLTFRGPSLEQHIFVSKADSTGLGRQHFSAAGVTRYFLQYLIKVDPRVYFKGASYSNTEIDAKGESFLGADSKSDTASIMRNVPCVSQTALKLSALSRKLRRDPSTFNILFDKARGLDTWTEPASELMVPIPELLQTRVSLFTRAADAYLFPGSEKNDGKHVADGNTLFKWWISILKYAIDGTWSCKADIPGSDRVSIEKYIPSDGNWEIGNIYVSKHLNDKAVHTIPLFPDDPKGRFLEHLIVENRYKSLNTSNFWNELGFRQEFRLGNVVGIIGCVKASDTLNGILEHDQTTVLSLKHYKKFRDIIKGEDYHNVDAIQNLWGFGICELAARLGANLQQISCVGSKVHSQGSSNFARSSLNSLPTVNILSVKKRARPASDIDKLVKKK